MIRFTTQVEERELVAAVHALGRDRVKRFIRLMLLYKDDQALLEECADAWCSRNSSGAHA
jgi:hypothetical protein